MNSVSAQVLAAICGTAGAIGVVVGAALLIVPGRMLRERRSFWRWLFETDVIALLDRRLVIERPLYRHHRALGAAVTAGAVALLMALWKLVDHPLVTDVLPRILGAWGVVSVIVASWALALFALGIGIFLIVRPSALKGFEAAANRWIELFPSVGRSGAPTREEFITRLVWQAPRLTALLLLAAGVGSLLAAVAIN